MRTVLLTLLVIAGCGAAATPGPSTPPAATQRSAERLSAACRAVGPRLTRCAIEDAQRTMSPAEFAALKADELAPRHTAEFVQQCEAQDLSARQLAVYERCAAATELACEPLLACLDDARAKPPAAR